MKNKYLLWFVILAVLAVGCEVSPDEPVKALSFAIDRYQDGDAESSMGTKTTMDDEGKFFWSACDTVGIYPNTGAQIYFELTAGEGASNAEFDGGGWDFKAASTYYSYYPFIGDIYLDRNRIPVSYLGQKQTGKTDISHIGPYDFMYTHGTSAESNNLHFAYKHMNCILRFRLTLPAGIYTRMAITATEDIFVESGYFDLMAATPTIVPVTYTDHLAIDLENVSSDGSEFRVFMMAAPVNIVGKQWVVSVWDSEKKEYQCPKSTSKIFEPQTIYGFNCTTWTEVPQSVGFSMQSWEPGTNIGGTAE